MAIGVKITDLPLVSAIEDSDLLIVARGDVTRKVAGSSFFRTKDFQEIETAIATLSTQTINVANTPTVLLFYNNQTRTLSAEIDIIPPQKGGTGFSNYLENHLLIGGASGFLERKILSATEGVELTKDQGYVVLTNTKQHSATNLSNQATASVVIVRSSTGTSTSLLPATNFTAGVMSAEDKRKLETLWSSQAESICGSFEVEQAHANSTIFVNSQNDLTITLPNNVTPGTKVAFVKVSNGNIQFVAGNGTKITTSPNFTYTQLTKKYAFVYAEYQIYLGWILSGELSSEFPRYLKGPAQVDTVQKVSHSTNNYGDVIYYKGDWDKTTVSFTSMTVYVNFQARTVIDFTTDRIGKPFAYRLESPIGLDTDPEDGPEYYGVFKTGNISLTAFAPQPTPYPTCTSQPTPTPTFAGGPTPTPSGTGPTPTPSFTPTQTSLAPTPTPTLTPTLTSINNALIAIDGSQLVGINPNDIFTSI